MALGEDSFALVLVRREGGGKPSIRRRHLRNAASRGQRGFALIGALVELAVVATLGAFAVRINMAQQHDADLELQQLHAEAALNSGVEYAATRLLAPGANSATLESQRQWLCG